MSSRGPLPGLTREQLSFFHENGYLIIPGIIPQATITKILNETHRHLREFSISDHPMTKFSTGGVDGKEHVGDKYFLESGDKIRFFFEEDAFNEKGELTKPKEQSINKIGHYLHGLCPNFRSITLTFRTAAIARDLGFRDPRVLQSMVICKQPEIGGAVPPHQDSTFLYTDPPSAVGFWFALEDATRENGCLSFAAGSHKREPVRKRFVRIRKEDGSTGTGFEENTGARFPRGQGPRNMGARKNEKEDDEEVEYTMGEVKAGDLVLIHGNLLHKSERNLSGKSRFIYTFHVIEGEERYDERNWLQPPKSGFTQLFPDDYDSCGDIGAACGASQMAGVSLGMF